MFFSKDSESSFSLRARFLVFLFTTLFVIFLGYGIAYWHARTLRNIVLVQSPKLILISQAADALLMSISSQKDFIPSYVLDQNPDWLLRLNNDWETAKQLVQNALAAARTPHEQQQIQDINGAYHRYMKSVERVIISYRRGVQSEIHNSRTEAASLFAYAEKLAKEFKEIQRQNGEEVQHAAEAELNRIQHFNIGLVSLITCMLFFFAWRAWHRIIYPLQILAGEDTGASFKGDKEITAVQSRIARLLQNAGETSRALARSRKSLEQAERMVVVAKLAASMAHSIRNPLTSVKMRLFSLNRSLHLDADQQEDFDVISDEIRHLDIVVQNFLEFARPPKLKVQSISPSEVIDRTLVLLNHRFEAYDVTVTAHRENSLPAISGDPEQLKEVFVNILENACQAMAGNPGTIDIFEDMAKPEKGEVSMPRIRICDSGPGIPEDFLAHVFEPFYTTKGEGTGLGLSIAYRIVENHGGTIDVHSTSEGTCFTICLPAISYPDTKGIPDGSHSDY